MAARTPPTSRILAQLLHEETALHRGVPLASRARSVRLARREEQGREERKESSRVTYCHGASADHSRIAALLDRSGYFVDGIVKVAVLA
jgi:hypothetical protein